MAEQVRKIEFTEEEKLRGWNSVDLNDWGDFYGDYVVPEERKIFGHWFPTEWALQETDDPELKQLSFDDQPFYVSISYMPLCENEEEELLQDPNATASDFLSLAWSDWILALQKEQELEEVRKMKNKVRVIEFSEIEKLRLNHIELEEYGDFRAEYIVPEKRRIVGWWTPTEEAIEELQKDGEIIGEAGEPLRAAIYYIPYNYELEREEKLLNDEKASASDFLELGWYTWEIYLENKD